MGNPAMQVRGDAGEQELSLLSGGARSRLAGAPGREIQGTGSGGRSVGALRCCVLVFCYFDRFFCATRLLATNDADLASNRNTLSLTRTLCSASLPLCSDTSVDGRRRTHAARMPSGHSLRNLSSPPSYNDEKGLVLYTYHNSCRHARIRLASLGASNSLPLSSSLGSLNR